MTVVAMLRGGIVLTAMLTLPGWFMLTFRAMWRQWEGLQRWMVAIGISIAFYPVLFYWARLLLPCWTMGPYKISTLLAGFALIVAWRMRGHWRDLVSFDQLEWIAIAVVGMTLFTRFWVIRSLPYPAWSDSLHHTLLTHLTAVQGRLPFTMEPYFPVPLAEYHLGLYSLTAIVEWLAQVPAHTALLWTAQALNGLCGIGVYLVLDRRVGRIGAVVGTAVVGLLSHQPAFYVNWGRFTQIASQAILLIAWLVTWEAVALWKHPRQEHKAKLIWNALVAATLSGAIFLLHFRVALFYLPLLLFSVAWEWWKAHRDKKLEKVALGTVVIGVLSLAVVAPAAWDALRVYVIKQLNLPVVPQETTRLMQQQYFEFPWKTVPILVSPVWLLLLTTLSVGLGLLRRIKMALIAALWGTSLYLIGNAYRLGIPFVSLTNLGAVLIMLYLPIGLVIGAAIQELVALLGQQRHQAMINFVAALVLGAGFVASHVRVTEIEPHRYFVTPEDIAAMAWIGENTETDAIFAVNTYFWLPDFPHGTDAGYWIPYFTGRQTTAGVMLFPLGGEEFRSRVIRMSKAAEQLAVDNSSLAELQSLGVDYVYIGAKGDFSGPGLNVAQLTQASNVTLVYQNAGVSILKIQTPDENSG